ncbi:uncharacterized protein EI97DRAFT_429710 [Westerdykella ornata]|uniref:Uncharacterized protein n=1 Tax=Westerdykella ornata TaxID=318751 RepID=A0A6A6JV20_WESOR|nr:uncharacterized protein EI97DRAFT_429710 [Westerdykella ornata]KAF2279943.1 hypothetical protein EI97DRAFT_429710 [Westerdykella ornata]
MERYCRAASVSHFAFFPLSVILPGFKVRMKRLLGKGLTRHQLMTASKLYLPAVCLLCAV